VSHFEGDSERLVEEFFAEHRRRVEELSADEVTWARIRDRHRSGRRQRRGALVGLVAAAAAVGFGAFALWPQPAPEGEGGLAGPGPTTSATQDATTAATATDEAPTDDTGTDEAPTDTGAGWPVVPPLTEEFELADVARVGDTFWAVGDQPGCGELAECPVLAVSQDAGATWETVSILDGLQDVQGVVVADARTAWVWGFGGMVVTRDGGQTFDPVYVAGDGISSVAAADGRVVVVTTRDCEHQRGCLDPRVAVGTPDDTDLVADALPLLPDVEDLVGVGTVTVGPDAVYVGLQREEDVGLAFEHALTDLLRVEGGTVERMATPQDCGAGPWDLAASPTVPGLVHAFCPVEGADLAFGVATSELGGRTWGGVGEGHPVAEGRFDATATDQGTLVVAAPGALLVSTDGGRTFGATSGPSEPAGGWHGLVADRGAVHVLGDTEPGAAPGFWTSGDGGLTWRRVDLTDAS
jgi:photosystem II stability/assembly factor-like uncharacterized protein